MPPRAILFAFALAWRARVAGTPLNNRNNSLSVDHQHQHV
jgi:hypothetical protein